MKKQCISFVWFVLFFCFVAAGCAPKKSYPRFVWPPPPEDPKVEFVGNFASEHDFALGIPDDKTLADVLLGKTVPLYSFKAPFGVASDGKGKVYVSDTVLRNIRCIDFARKHIYLLAEEGELKAPTGIDIDNSGRVYAADADRAAVIVFEPSGNVAMKVSDEHIPMPVYVEVDEGLGRIYVSDQVTMQVAAYSLEGTYLFSFGEKGVGAGQFAKPAGLAVDSEHRVFVVDSLNARIQVFSSDGELLYMFGERGDMPHQFEHPADATFDTEGNLWITESRKSTLRAFSPSGDLLMTLGQEGGGGGIFSFAAPRGVFADVNDRIYVAEIIGKRISLWQYMSDAYLEKNPYTQSDKEKLQAYIAEIQEKKRLAREKQHAEREGQR